MDIKSTLKNRIHIYKEYREKNFSLGDSLVFMIVHTII